MKNWNRFIHWVACAAVIALCVASVAVVQAETGDGLQIEGAVTIIAQVVAIDKADRIVTVKGPAGNIAEIEAGEEVRNFDQINVGDDVKLTYYESVALYVGAPGTLPEVDGAVVTARAAKGDKPGAVVLGAIDIAAIVTAIDKGKRELTLKYPDGHTVTSAVDESIEKFDELEVGDSIHARVTRALAIAVEAH